LDVAFLPRDLREPERSVCIVVDLVRATTTMTTLYEAGCLTVYAAPTIESAREAALEHHAVLCGERDGLKVPGFDYGNSPVEFHRLDLHDRQVVLSTTNGTLAIHAASAAPAVLAGCLRNASAVVERATELAGPRGLGVTIVCAGREGRFALDDAYCAGHLIALLRKSVEPSSLDLTDSAVAAENLRLSNDDALAVVSMSSSGRGLTHVGLGHDLPFVAEVDRSEVVPELVRGDTIARYPLRLVSPR